MSVQGEGIGEKGRLHFSARVAARAGSWRPRHRVQRISPSKISDFIVQAERPSLQKYRCSELGFLNILSGDERLILQQISPMELPFAKCHRTYTKLCFYVGAGT